MEEAAATSPASSTLLYSTLYEEEDSSDMYKVAIDASLAVGFMPEATCR
jgi:hypothetical protein